MPRPSRYELVQKMFPELRTSGGTTGDKEAAIGINQRAAEAILGDFIGLYDKGFAALGPGVLNIRLSKDSTKTSEYVTHEEITSDAELAHKFGDVEIAEAMGDVASVVESFNPSKAALVLLVDNSGFRLLPLDRDNPASTLVAIMEEFQHG